MIQKENNSSRKIKENKYKILRMSLLLGTDTDKEETIINFEDAAREIDSMNNETYLSELEPKFYDTKTLEEEREKLLKEKENLEQSITRREKLLSNEGYVTRAPKAIVEGVPLSSCNFVISFIHICFI